MYSKRNVIVLHMHRIFLLLKSTKLMFFVPLLVIDICIPLLNYLCYRHNGIGDELYQNINQFAQMLIPFFSVWWNVFIMREFLEADGNEMLYVCKEKRKSLDFAAIFMLYIFNIIALYVVYIQLFDGMKAELVKIILICLFYYGLMYFISRLTGSVNAALLILLVYTVVNIASYKVNGAFPLYYTTNPANREILISSAVLGFCGILLLVASTQCRLKKQT